MVKLTMALSPLGSQYYCVVPPAITGAGHAATVPSTALLDWYILCRGIKRGRSWKPKLTLEILDNLIGWGPPVVSWFINYKIPP